MDGHGSDTGASDDASEFYTLDPEVRRMLIDNDRLPEAFFVGTSSSQKKRCLPGWNGARNLVLDSIFGIFICLHSLFISGIHCRTDGNVNAAVRPVYGLQHFRCNGKINADYSTDDILF